MSFRQSLVVFRTSPDEWVFRDGSVTYGLPNKEDEFLFDDKKISIIFILLIVFNFMTLTFQFSGVSMSSRPVDSGADVTPSADVTHSKAGSGTDPKVSSNTNNTNTKTNNVKYIFFVPYLYDQKFLSYTFFCHRSLQKQIP